MTLVQTHAATGTLLDLSVCEAEPIRTPNAIQAYGCLLILRGEDGRLKGFSANAGTMLAQPLALGQALDQALGVPIWSRIQAGLAIGAASSRPRLIALTDCAPDLDARFEVLAHRTAGQIIVEFSPRDNGGPAPPTGVRPEPEQIKDLYRLCLRTADQIRDLTGYDRVMVYRFLPDWSGEVIAERRLPELTPYLGLRYPASDIPSQARQLYRETPLRLIGDVEGPIAALISETPGIDLSQAALRSVSPYHLAYLKNMGVGATLTLSILIEGELWGLVACHHRLPRRLNHPVASRALGLAERLAADIQMIQTQEAQRKHSVLQATLKVWHGRQPADLSVEPLLADLGLLINDLRADGLAFVCGDFRLMIGATPGLDWLSEAIPRLAAQSSPGTILATNQLSAEAWSPPPPERVAGAMAAVLAEAPRVALFVFRSPMVHDVTWGGDPTEPALHSPLDGKISPRRSFALWRQLVQDQAAVWTQDQQALFGFCADWLAGVQARDGEDFVENLSAALHLASGEYLTLGDPQRLLIDILPEGAAILIWVSVNGERTLLHASRAFTDLFGFELSDLRSEGAATLLELTRINLEALDAALGLERDMDVWSPTKGPRRVRARRELLVCCAGFGPVRMVEGLLLEDITGAVRVQEALLASVRQAEAAESARYALMRNMSHELRTPLNAITGYSDLLSQQLLGPVGHPAYLQAAQEIQAGARHLLSLIENSLDMARLNEGQLSLTETRIDLDAVITEALNLLKPLAEASDVALIWRPPSLPVVALVDELAVRQVVINLLNNAIKFTPKGGVATVCLINPHGGDLHLTVSDTGIGIPSEAIGRLFQPFTQLDSSMGRRQGGSGLGLSIVKALVQLHGGTISVDSVEGKGSTFTVRLPAWRTGRSA